MVHINDQPINDEPHVTFGGVKGSGLGRYNGEDIMRKFAEECWISVQHEGNTSIQLLDVAGMIYIPAGHISVHAIRPLRW